MAVLTFDGDDLNLNDSVYDVAYGSGIVTEIMDRQNQFRVKFGERSFTYKLNGQSMFPRKTLFWREPIGRYYPRKNDTNWATFSNLRDAIAHALDITGN